jgi:hypothetical protein
VRHSRHIAILILLWVAARPARGQEPAFDAPKQQEETTKPAPPSEGFRVGLMEGRSEIELGYRFVSGAGNRDVYRSMINLGEGPKLLRSSVSLRSNYGSGALFDRLDFQLDNWGGDPYNTMRLRASLADKYELQASYRNLNYYNFLPAFSNPLLATGGMLGQHSLNVTQRTTDLELRLFPGSRVRPFVGYARSSGFGPGFTTFRSDGNEFVLDTNWRYAADEIRGGVELRLPRLDLTLEQGFRYLRNDTSAESSGSNGNTSRPLLGQTVTLDSLDRGYHDRTRIPVSKILAKFTPTDRLRLTGRYIYSMADVDSTFSQIDTGNLVSIEDRLLYRTAADSFDTRAKRPSTTAGLLAEFSPLARVTLTDLVDARSYHVAGAALLASTFYSYRPIGGLPDGKTDRRIEQDRDSYLSYDQVRNQAEVELDVGRGFALRGGHRYTYVETQLSDRESSDTEARGGSFTQQTALAGVWFRRGHWLRLGLDYENNTTQGALTRTDLLDYDQLRLNWQVRGSKLTASGKIGLARNSNPAPEVDLDAHNRSYSFAFDYEASERFRFSVDYERANLYSNIAILLPQTFATDRSVWTERTHAVGASLGVGLCRGAKVDLGYRSILSAGTLPLNYHQPFAQLSIPLGNRLVWRGAWQYYGYNEKGASFQDHRTHLVTFSLAVAY